MYVDLVFVSLVLLVLIMGNWKKKRKTNRTQDSLLPG